MNKIWIPANFLDGSKWIDSNRDCGVCPHSEKVKQILTILNVSGQELVDTDWHYCGYWINPENAIDHKKPYMTCRQAVLKLKSLVDNAMIAAKNPRPVSITGELGNLELRRAWRRSAEDLANLTGGMKRVNRVLPRSYRLQVVLDAKSLCDQLCLVAFGTVDPSMIMNMTKDVEQGCPQRP